MEYLYYQQKICQRMSKKESESKKNYSNIEIQKIDPLSSRLSDVGMTGGASKKLKFKDTRTKTERKLELEKFKQRITKKENLKIKKKNIKEFLKRDSQTNIKMFEKFTGKKFDPFGGNGKL